MKKNDLEFKKFQKRAYALLEELESLVEQAFEKVYEKRAERAAKKKAA